MDKNEYKSLDALGITELVKRGDASVEEVVEAAIQVVEEDNGKTNAVIRPMFDEARRASIASIPNGIFMGVPFCLKISF